VGERRGEERCKWDVGEETGSKEIA